MSIIKLDSIRASTRVVFFVGFFSGGIFYSLFIPWISRFRVVVVEKNPAPAPIYVPSAVPAPVPIAISGIDDEGLSMEQEYALASLDVEEKERPKEKVYRKAKRRVKTVTRPVVEMTDSERDLDGFRRHYIDQFGPIARSASTSRVPASYLLALALTRGGSAFALKANNHFDVRCTSTTCPEGHCLRSDHPDQHKWFFTKYKTVAASYAAKAKSVDFVNLQDPAVARVISLYNLKRFDK